MTISAKDVQSLRQRMGVGMMDAKKALEEASGEVGKAEEILRVKGLADAKKREGREANEGTIGVYIHQPGGYPTVGVLVELTSETDFVAKGDEFQAAARDIAMHVAALQPGWVTVDEVPEDVLAHERGIIEAQARDEGKNDDIIPKIVEGRVKAFYKDNVLYEQEYVKTDDFEGTVGEMVGQLAGRLGENIAVRRFARFKVGEEA